MTSSSPYQPLPNAFRQAVRNGRPMIGCWASLAKPDHNRVARHGRVRLDAARCRARAERRPHADSAIDGAEGQPQRAGRAAARNDSVVIKRLLDSGFFNFLVPFVDSAADAVRAVAATRYPPQGIRGVSVGIAATATGPCQTTSNGERQYLRHGADRKPQGGRCNRRNPRGRGCGRRVRRSVRSRGFVRPPW